MSKKSAKSTKLFVGKVKKDYSVAFGKYKEKSLIWVAKNDLIFFKEIQNLYYSKYNSFKQEYYNKLKVRFVTNNVALDQSNQEKIQEVVALLREKNNSDSIKDILHKKYKLTSIQAGIIIADANNFIRKEFEIEKDFLLDIHLIRYEEIYDNNFNPDLSHVKLSYRKAIECEHKLTAMDTLFQKERLLGIHTKNFKQKMNASKFSLQKELEFDITKLKASEQLEVLALLNKAKPIEKLIRGVVNTNPLDIDTSIHKIKEEIIEAPIQQAVQTDKVQELEGNRLKSTGKNLFEVQQVMKQTLEEKVKELFEKKNKK